MSGFSNLFTIDSRVYGIPYKKDIDRLSKAIVQSANEISFEVLHAEAEKLARMVREEIDAQPERWPALNADYKAWKDRNGLNTDMLKATEAYYNAIYVQEIRDHRGRYTSAAGIHDVPRFTIRVGVPPTRHPGLGDGSDKGNNIRFTELATILEFGTDKIPPRPHWTPAYTRWKSQHARSIKARITSLAMRRFKQDFKKLISKKSKAKKVRNK